MADLAYELGVSTATVSRALKDYPDISTETKTRVLELAKAWNYRPNSLAASLRKQESRTLGVLVPQIVNHFFSSVINGIVDEVYDKGYRVILCQSNESTEKESVNTDALVDSQVDGVLVSVGHDTTDFKHFQMFVDEEVPVVFFDKVPQGFDVCSKVVVDDYEGAKGAIKHLVEQGCRRIAHCGGPFQAYTGSERLRGYKDGIAEASHTYDETLVKECAQATIEEGDRFGHELMQMTHKPDAIFCVTDAVALGAMRAIKSLGFRIPDDVAVVGFSDWEIGALVEPQLSSVAQPGYDMGKIAVGLLLKEIKARKEKQPFEPETQVLLTELKVRGSSQRR